MRPVKVKEGLSIVDAVDLLSSLSEIDLSLAAEKQEKGLGKSLTADWLNAAKIQENQELIKETFSTVKRYLEQVYERGSAHLKDPYIQKGVAALMTLAVEAAEKIDKFTELFKAVPGVEGLADLPEYRDLNEYYFSALAPHFPALAEIDESWEEEWGVKRDELSDSKKRRIRNVDEVKSDRGYELFYLLKEDGRPFYDYEILRHIRLIYDFDQAITDSEAEDVFHKILFIQDKDFLGRSQNILKTCSHLVDDFYKEALRYKDNNLVSNMNKALMALMLCANPRNLLQNTSAEKSCRSYFSDFHFYLREALATEEYQRLLSASTHDAHPFQFALYMLSHKLCSAYFLSLSGQKEMVALIRRIMAKGQKQEEGKNNEPVEKLTIAQSLLQDDEALRNVLSQYPTGAINKVAEIFQKGEQAKGFDPFSQKNPPSQLFTFSRKDKEVMCLRVPAPIKQEFIQKAEELWEFQTYLRSLVLGSKKQKYLMINLQDRTSWQEHARCVLLEEMHRKEDFQGCFYVLGLPKHSEFYFQTELYNSLEETPLFLEQMQQQVEGGEQCGFYFPDGLKSELREFTAKALPMIHELFFHHKKHLKREERQDFIEILYFFMTLKALEILDADYLSFTSKDAIDVGAAASAEHFAFLKILTSDKPWMEDEKGFLIWMLYAPALSLRERAIDKDCFLRVVSALASFQKGILENRKQFDYLYGKLFQRPLWEELKIPKAE